MARARPCTRPRCPSPSLRAASTRWAAVAARGGPSRPSTSGAQDVAAGVAVCSVRPGRRITCSSIPRLHQHPSSVPVIEDSENPARSRDCPQRDVSDRADEILSRTPGYRPENEARDRVRDPASHANARPKRCFATTTSPRCRDAEENRERRRPVVPISSTALGPSRQVSRSFVHGNKPSLVSQAGQVEESVVCLDARSLCSPPQSLHVSTAAARTGHYSGRTLSQAHTRERAAHAEAAPNPGPTRGVQPDPRSRPGPFTHTRPAVQIRPIDQESVSA